MIITHQSDLENFCNSLKGEEFITIDTEFLREKTYFPKLCLIQIGDKNKKAAAIDPLSSNIDLQPVFDLLLDKNILKIFHAGRQDLEIFYQLMDKKLPTPIFDTQIAAMVCGYGDQVGYDNLVRQITNTHIDKSSQFTNWSIRPLSEKQINYALGDVTHLVDVYFALAEELEKRSRTKWVHEEKEILTNPQTYETDPYEMWKKVKIKTPKPQTLAILRELAAWRETRAQKKNLPKNWVMKDDTLADMAAQAPTKAEGLKKIRNLSGDIASGKHGKDLIRRIQSVLETSSQSWPQPKKRKTMPPNIQATTDILKMLLKINALDNDVAPKLIASADDIEKLAESDDAAIPALKGWRLEVFGKEALLLKNGKLSIGIKDGKITKFKV